MNLEKWLDISADVAQAQKEGRAVVALESTIIAHGMPYPLNVQTAKEVEAIIREHGAVPATIAILDGKIKIGLSDQELERIAQGAEIEKVSRRDLAYVLTTRKDSATTVAATMICAHLAKIAIFVTGGIGGVHRDVEETMDISADLTELALTNVAVVCAGAKSILDIGRTLEYLETVGVPVVGYQTEEFPAFYSRRSGFAANFSLSSPQEVAQMLHTKWTLGLRGGAVVANPVPEEYALDTEYMRGIIDAALQEAREKRITGKRITPFLLAKIEELTGGLSLKTNIALVKHNAEVGAKIAVALTALQ
ncbi:MAG: pseudouridine-5'-phosphate glycosidase [Ktedonobacteraceae bacterium]|nr:pseudouridine-5'-phosphate glycosidase [Ktedonobacteraceae bacterium]